VCFALPETSHFTFADGFFVIVVGTLGMMVPASGGIGAFHFAMKIGIGALFFSYGKTFEKGHRFILCVYFSYDAIGNYGSNGLISIQC
jgi:hypothetical protein